MTRKKYDIDEEEKDGTEREEEDDDESSFGSSLITGRGYLTLFKRITSFSISFSVISCSGSNRRTERRFCMAAETFISGNPLGWVGA